MGELECFICGEELLGDSDYVTHHINTCLDSSAQADTAVPDASQGAADAASPSSVEKPEQSRDGAADQKKGKKKKKKNTLGPSVSSDAVLARALAEQQDEEAALALSRSELAAPHGNAAHLAPHDCLGQSSPSGAVSGAGCPSCSHSWNALGVGSAQVERSEHVAMCLDAQAWEDFKVEVDKGGPALPKGGFGKGKALLKPRGIATFSWKDAGKGASAVKGTRGLVRVLQSLLSRSHSEGKTQTAFLANERTEHIHQGVIDKLWGCGYRNAQMLFSSLRYLDQYSNMHGEPASGRAPLPPIPTIKDLQNIIELAWDNGHDPPGAEHFNGKLIGSRKWIGTTEIYVALTWLGVRARIVDFPKVQGSEGTHQALVKFIHAYFSTPSMSPTGSKRPLPSGSAESSSSTNALQTLMSSGGSAIKLTSKQPLYLQHQGHSRTVVGIDVGKGGEWLLLYDPGKQVSMSLSHAAASQPSPSSTKIRLDPSPKRPKSLSPTPSGASSSSSATGNALGLETAKATGEDAFWAQTPGFEQIWHGKSTAKGAKEGSNGSGAAKGLGSASSSSSRAASGLDLSLYGKMLEPYRVSLRSLSKKDEYQIICIEEGPPLTQLEKNVRKVVKSSVIKE